MCVALCRHVLYTEGPEKTPGFQTEMFFRFCVNPTCSLQTPAKKMDPDLSSHRVKGQPLQPVWVCFLSEFSAGFHFVSTYVSGNEFNGCGAFVTGPGKMPLTIGFRLNTLPGLCKWFLFCAWGEMLPS